MDKKDGDGMLALDLAPDKEVSGYLSPCQCAPRSRERSLTDWLGAEVYREGC